MRRYCEKLPLLHFSVRFQFHTDIFYIENNNANDRANKYKNLISALLSQLKNSQVIRHASVFCLGRSVAHIAIYLSNIVKIDKCGIVADRKKKF